MNEIEVLPIDIRYLNKVNELEFFHRDPFDRLIIAQAMVEELTLISKDTQFTDYDLRLLW